MKHQIRMHKATLYVIDNFNKTKGRSDSEQNFLFYRPSFTFMHVVSGYVHTCKCMATQFLQNLLTRIQNTYIHYPVYKSHASYMIILYTHQRSPTLTFTNILLTSYSFRQPDSSFAANFDDVR